MVDRTTLTLALLRNGRRDPEIAHVLRRGVATRLKG
jgi:hypothetical protein